MSSRMPIVGDHVLYDTADDQHRNGDIMFPALVVAVHSRELIDLCILFPKEPASLRFRAQLLGSEGCGVVGWCWPPP